MTFNYTPQPKKLDEWLQLLDNTKLPVSSSHKLRVSQALANPRNSLSDISKVISSAPTIALIFFREANKKQGSFSEPAQHLDAVLTRLGMTQCTKLLNRLDCTPEQDIALPLRQLCLISRHANAQANELFAFKLARLWQDIHWGSLLFLAPLWPLITRHPGLFVLWERRVLGNSEEHEKVEHELFGTSLTLLCQALAQRWLLPDWVIKAYQMLNENRELLARTFRIAKLHDQPLQQQLLLDEQKDISLWYRQPANSILIANGLAIDAHYSWVHEHCLRWQRFTGLFLDWPLDKVQKTMHEITVEHARKEGKTVLWHPVQALIWPWCARRLSRPKHKVAQPQPTPTSQAHSLSPAQLKEWQEKAQQMLLKPSPFANHARLLDAMRQMLAAAGLKRLAILAVQHKTAQLQPIYQHKFAFVLRQPLTQSVQAPIMQKLLRRNSHLHVHEHNISQLKKHLGDDFMTAIHSQNFVCGSIYLNNKATILIIADAKNEQLHATTLKVFNASCRYFEQALATLQHH